MKFCPNCGAMCRIDVSSRIEDGRKIESHEIDCPDCDHTGVETRVNDHVTVAQQSSENSNRISGFKWEGNEL
jgi:hypothetical protein